MRQVWYYAQGGSQFGPVVAKELHDLASVGKLRPADLVWRDGMPEWMPASKVKGLFRAGAVPTPPSLPQSAAPSPTDAAMPSVAPPLWNPRAAQAWSLVLSWAFGSFLLARNWRALGDTNRAKRCMVWFYAVFPWILLALVTPNTPAMTGFFRFGSLAAFVVWSSVEALPQFKRVKDAFGNQYPRKKWPKPLGIGAACLAGFGLLAGIGHSKTGVAERGPRAAEAEKPSLDELIALLAITAVGVAAQDNLGANTGPDEFNDLMRSAARELRAGNHEDTRELLQIAPTSRKEFLTSEGIRGLVLRYGSRTSATFSKNPQTGKWQMFAATFGYKEWNCVTGIRDKR